MNHVNWLEKRARLSGEKTALVFKEETISFTALYQAADRAARELNKLGVGAHTRVALLGKNTPEMVIVIHALQLLGAVAVFLNPRLSREEMAYQVGQSKAACLLYDETFAVLREGQDISCYSFAELAAIEPISERPVPTLLETDVCSVMYTSGTTGRPKGVMQTYRNHFFSSVGSMLNLGLEPEQDAWLCVVPIFHISGLSILMRSVIYGIPVYLEEKFDPERVAVLLKSGRITHISVVMAMVKRLLDISEGGFHDRLKIMLLGGSAAPKELVRRCLERNIPLVQSFGMTETASQVVTLQKEKAMQKIGSSGQALFPVEIRIQKDGRSAAPFVLGEIELTGPNITPGYLDDPAATRAAMDGDWFKTGDIGYLDDEGYLYVSDRRKDLIISGGENIYPTEIEHLLLDLDGINEVAVVGKKDPEWGEVPIAFYTGETLNEAELTAYLRERLAHFKVPKAFYHRESLPKTASGKIQRHLLKE
ncbi:o-succinylbenzoate--CoA ligase [Listeria costaricensis]|uniref:o-succinylbenzoate--CoA ligase n=1 Tax=Listeria costaricensis TaxID=2026604 RepID=UPI000C07F6BD|nr:o-succinylbenzoate--CoA ligase [Listeria costaricensis]